VGRNEAVRHLTERARSEGRPTSACNRRVQPHIFGSLLHTRLTHHFSPLLQCPVAVGIFTCCNSSGGRTEIVVADLRWVCILETVTAARFAFPSVLAERVPVFVDGSGTQAHPALKLGSRGNAIGPGCSEVLLLEVISESRPFSIGSQRIGIQILCSPICLKPFLGSLTETCGTR
jgi:hypothetical protein